MNKLLNNVSELAKVSFESARAYDRRKGVLISRVNRILEQRDDLYELIGTVDFLDMMYDNHINHAKILTTTLYLNSYRLLASLLPWVYDTYHRHGFSFDYFPVELNAWKKAVENELEPEFSREIIPVYDWMLNQHEKLIAIVRESSDSGDELLSPEADQFLTSLMTKNIAEAVKMGESSMREFTSPEIFYSLIAQPSMYKIGYLWQTGKITAADEHLASAITQNVVANMQLSGPSPSKNKGRAVISAAAGELHELGARMLGHCFEADGWEVDFLGANSPLKDTVDYCKKVKPDFIGLSVAMPYHLHHVQHLIDRFKAEEELKNLPVMVGGSVFKLLPEATGCLNGATVIIDIKGALKTAKEWLNGE
ncbi:MAG: cobalamin B12-binding domain-containing protein [Candidatus Rifleibacteriota bacterium]